MTAAIRKLSAALIWDAPTRLFHWALVGLVALAWFTGEGEGTLFVVHRLAGYGVAVLLIFRLIWGFAGSRHARFADFLGSWRGVRDQIVALLRRRPVRTLGHNPLGGWMVVLLLLVLAGQVGTGLFSADDGIGGPLSRAISPGPAHAVAELHEGLSNVLLLLIGVHVLGVLVESLLTRDNLVSAMITGRKTVSPYEAATARTAFVAPAWRALLALGAAGAVVWLIVA
jgi:cytochrome b